MNDRAKIMTFGTYYAEAWCEQNAKKVAAFFAGNRSLRVNDRCGLA